MKWLKKMRSTKKTKKKKKTWKYGTLLREFMLWDFLVDAVHPDFGRIRIHLIWTKWNETKSTAWWSFVFVLLYACTLPLSNYIVYQIYTIVIHVVRYARVTHWYGQNCSSSFSLCVYRYCFRCLLAC